MSRTHGASAHRGELSGRPATTAGHGCRCAAARLVGVLTRSRLVELGGEFLVALPASATKEVQVELSLETAELGGDPDPLPDPGRAEGGLLRRRARRQPVRVANSSAACSAARRGRHHPLDRLSVASVRRLAALSDFRLLSAASDTVGLMQDPEVVEVQHPPEPWVSVEDIAEHLACSTDSVYRWLARQGLPGHRVGRVWRFKISEVDAWVRTGAANDVATKEAS